MRWRLGIVLSLVFGLVLVPFQAQGHSLWKHPKIRKCLKWDWRESRYERRRMILCYGYVLDPPGTPNFALCIAQHESGLDPYATSPSGTYRGIYQQSGRYWWGRYQTYGAYSHLDPNVYNARTNTVVSMRMAKAVGTWYKDWGAADNCD